MSKGPYPYACPTCGETVMADAAYRARQQLPCRACIRVRNGWTCRDCGSADPKHPSPCPEEGGGVSVSRLSFSPLTERELMVRQAEAEDRAAQALRAAVRAPEWHDVHYRAARLDAQDANEIAAALAQRIGWEPIGVKQGYRHANGAPA